MKLGKLFLGLTLMVTTSGVFAQDQDKECKRMRFLAGKYLDVEDYKKAASFYIKGEDICGGYEKDNYNRTIGTLRNVISTEQDPSTKALYVDTILAVFDRAEEADQYDSSHDLARAAFIAQKAEGDRKKADTIFTRGMSAQGSAVHESYVVLYYYNLYMIYAEAPAESRSEAKKTLITKYFELSKLATDAEMGATTIQMLNQYFNAAVQSCDDILPELSGFMETLPSDKAQKKTAVKNFITLLEDKNCTDSDEYATLIDTLIQIDPSSFDAVIAKAKLEEGKKDYSSALNAYKNAEDLTEDATELEEIEYAKLRCLFGMGSYSSAHNAALRINGTYKGDALKIAAQSVARNKNNCGASTVDRKMNYYYAVDLLERARANGASVGSLIGSYKAGFPTTDEKFSVGLNDGDSFTISCYGVTVTIK